MQRRIGVIDLGGQTVQLAMSKAPAEKYWTAHPSGGVGSLDLKSSRKGAVEPLHTTSYALGLNAARERMFKVW